MKMKTIVKTIIMGMVLHLCGAPGMPLFAADPKNKSTPAPDVYPQTTEPENKSRPAPQGADSGLEIPIINQNFSEGLKNWSRVEISAGKESPDYSTKGIALVAKDANNAKKIIQLTLDQKDFQAKSFVSNTGLVFETPRMVVPRAKLEVTLEAKSISGDDNLYVGRLFGGGGANVKLNKEWGKYTVAFEFAVMAVSNRFIISLGEQNGVSACPVKEGVVLIDNVRMRYAEISWYDKRKLQMTPDEAAWEKTLDENLGSVYNNQYIAAKFEGKETAWDYVKDDPKLPRVLLIGDSISRGYTMSTRHALQGKANLHRAPENCLNTDNGVKKMDWYLGKDKWDVIHFNFGIHDHIRKVPVETYLNNLQKMITRMKTTGATLIWASTTPLPAAGTYSGDDKIVKLNESAAEIMKKNGVLIDDLYTFIKPHQAEWQLPNNDCHFIEERYEIIGQQVAKSILDALAAKSLMNSR